ncbi:MAG: hypothetical protein M3N41_03945 [Acidobacteriota bacterium]|nr:hypothetical protein [Acidobacteriota bacterium]
MALPQAADDSGMNVYNRATGWGTFTTIVLLAAVLALDVWLMDKLPILQHGMPYVILQAVMVGLLLKLIRLIFRRGGLSH